MLSIMQHVQLQCLSKERDEYMYVQKRVWLLHWQGNKNKTERRKLLWYTGGSTHYRILPAFVFAYCVLVNIQYEVCMYIVNNSVSCDCVVDCYCTVWRFT